jgi:hypothetical protein
VLVQTVNVQIVIVLKDVYAVTKRNQNDVHVKHVHVRIVVVQSDAIVVQNKKDLIRGLSYNL